MVTPERIAEAEAILDAVDSCAALGNLSRWEPGRVLVKSALEAALGEEKGRHGLRQLEDLVGNIDDHDLRGLVLLVKAARYVDGGWCGAPVVLAELLGMVRCDESV